MLDTLIWICGCVWIFSLGTYILPQLLVRMRSVQNLKEKYNAKWALVTGGSSGIGRAVVERLAKQDINIIVAAYPDAVLDKACEEYSNMFPSIQVRKVGVDMSKPDFMKGIVSATEDIDVNIVINNAGYIKTGFFCGSTFGAQLANHNVNATAAIECTHHFATQMRAKKLRGCITFTSSPAGFMPAPLSVLYGATKAYLTSFAQSLAAEVNGDGIDVSVVHPSPTATRFYDKAHAMDALVFFKNTATGPEHIAEALLANVGRAVTIDQGYYGPCVRLLLRIVDINFLAGLIASIAEYLPDYKAMKKAQ